MIRQAVDTQGRGSIGLSWPAIRVLMVSLIASVAIYASLDTEQQYIAGPALIMVCIGSVFVAEIWNREGRFPLLNIGIWTVSTTVLYSAFPLIQHLFADMEWTILSDNRLLQYKPTPEDFGRFAWNNVAYLVSFAVAYGVACRGIVANRSSAVHLERRIIVSAALLFVAATLVSGLIDTTYGITGDFYGEGRMDNIAQLQSMPLLIKQLRIHLAAARLFFEIVLVMSLVSRLQLRYARWGICLLLIVQCLVTLTMFGSRTNLIFSILIVALLYHRIRKPLNLFLVALGSVLVLGGALFYGYARDYVSAYREIDIEDAVVTPLSSSNEFMSLYATAYDVHSRVQDGSLPSLPVQGYLSDLLMLIPQQLLPFAKVDPSEWYLDILEMKDEGVGFMWGVISSAEVGYGIPELIVRGIVLGIGFAWFHRWYMRRGSDWRVLSLYLMMCLWAYYTFRASSFYFLVLIQYRFVVPLLAIESVRMFIGLPERSRPGCLSFRLQHD